jgi:hypothetical protein
LAPPIRIEWLKAGEVVDLVSALAVRGLIGKPVREGRRHAVAVHDPHEDPRRLLAEVVDALEAWLADRGRETMVVRVGGAMRTVRAGGDLPSSLQARVGRTQRHRSRSES